MPARLHHRAALRAEMVAALVAAGALAACGDSTPAARSSGEDAQTARTAVRAPPPVRPAAGAATRRTVVRRLRGRRVAVGDRDVALDPATLTCVGVGRPTAGGRAPTWPRFRCVQPTFPPGATVGPDLVFSVDVRAGGALVVSGARLTRY
jgi:hypothetical protein